MYTLNADMVTVMELCIHISIVGDMLSGNGTWLACKGGLAHGGNDPDSSPRENRVDGE